MSKYFFLHITRNTASYRDIELEQRELRKKSPCLFFFQMICRWTELWDTRTTEYGCNLLFVDLSFLRLSKLINTSRIVLHDDVLINNSVSEQSIDSTTDFSQVVLHVWYCDANLSLQSNTCFSCFRSNSLGHSLVMHHLQDKCNDSHQETHCKELKHRLQVSEIHGNCQFFSSFRHVVS